MLVELEPDDDYPDEHLRWELIKMSQINFTNQRADKIRVRGIVGPMQYRGDDGIPRESVAKDIEHFTITCDECGGTGYYDEIGEVICDGCGLVLSGDKKPVVPYEYSEGLLGSSRGMGTLDESEGTHEPSI